MGAPKKYSKKALKAAVQAYFDSITREVTITERKDSGKRDKYGHVIYDVVPVENKLGQIAKTTEYLVPPTLGGLCIHLGIVNSTWSRWCNETEHPEYKEIIDDVKERLLTWRQEQVVSRKNVKGVIWDLEVNFGCGQKKESAPQMTVVLQGEIKDYAE